MGMKKVCELLAKFVLADLHTMIRNLTEKVELMSQALADLTAEVAQNTTVVDSAIALITGLKAKIDELIAAGNNDPALKALSDSLDAKTNELAAAVAANTPTVPTP